MMRDHEPLLIAGRRRIDAANQSQSAEKCFECSLLCKFERRLFPYEPCFNRAGFHQVAYYVRLRGTCCTVAESESQLRSETMTAYPTQGSSW